MERKQRRDGEADSGEKWRKRRSRREKEREWGGNGGRRAREGEGRRDEREQEERHEREPGSSGVLGRSVERAITSTRDAWALSLSTARLKVFRTRPRAG